MAQNSQTRNISGRRVFFATLVASTLMLAAGCASPSAGEPPETSPGDSEWDAVVEAAKSEGPVTFFNPTDELTGQKVADAFTADTGLQAQSVRIASADLATRFSSEAEAGAVAVDVLIDANLDFIPEAVDNSWVLEPTAELLPELQNYPDDWNHDGAVTFSIMPWGICYNTDRVEAPSDWNELTSTSFADQLILPNPEVSVAYIEQWAMLGEELGEDYLREVGENVALIAGGGPPAMEALAAGEGSINSLCTENLAHGSQEAGAPVEFTLPSPTTGIHQVMGIAADAPNPNAARVFANWLLSERGVEAFNEIQPSSLTVYKEPEVEIVDAPADYEESTTEIVSLLGLD